jgi:hypothetical protein
LQPADTSSTTESPEPLNAAREEGVDDDGTMLRELAAMKP